MKRKKWSMVSITPARWYGKPGQASIGTHALSSVLEADHSSSDRITLGRNARPGDRWALDQNLFLVGRQYAQCPPQALHRIGRRCRRYFEAIFSMLPGLYAHQYYRKSRSRHLRKKNVLGIKTSGSEQERLPSILRQRVRHLQLLQLQLPHHSQIDMSCLLPVPRR